MPVAVRSIIFWSLVGTMFLVFQGSKYILNNRLQELGLFLALMLFLYSAILAALNDRKPNLNWTGWIIGTLGLIGYVMLVPAYLYSNHTGAPMLPSALAAREYMVLMLCPAIYFLYRIGYPLEELERAFYTTIIAIIFVYMFFRFTLPLEQMKDSPNRHVKALIAYDPERGYRLVWPEMAITLAMVVSPIKIYLAKVTRERVIWIMVMVLTLWAMVLYQGRSFTAGLILSVLAFHFLFARKKRVIFLLFLAPLVISMYFGAIVKLFETVEEEFRKGEGIRFHSYSIAFDVISKHPMLGFGMDSKTTISEEKIFGSTFHSSDIGIIGITFRYGIIGASVFVLYVFWLNIRLIKANWMYFEIYQRNNPILIALSVRCLMDILNIVLSTTFIYMPGLTVACLGIAFSAIYKQELQQHKLQLLQNQ